MLRVLFNFTWIGELVRSGFPTCSEEKWGEGKKEDGGSERDVG